MNIHLETIASRIENLQLANATLTQQCVSVLVDIKDLIINMQTAERQDKRPNPMNRYGQKCFSQSDEDGITLEIIKRLDITEGVYAEFGVGDGMENNTLTLAALDGVDFG